MPDISLTPGGLLTALQLADSFFPSGMYAHSHGLEAMVRRGLVQNPMDVAEFLENQFNWTVMPSDGVALLESCRAAAQGDLSQIVAIDELLLAMKAPTELRNASTQLGLRLLSEAGEWASLPPHPLLAEYTRLVRAGNYPGHAPGYVPGYAPGNGAVALGVVGQALGVDAAATLMVLCHSYAVSVLGAARPVNTLCPHRRPSYPAPPAPIAGTAERGDLATPLVGDAGFFAGTGPGGNEPRMGRSPAFCQLTTQLITQG